jgi:hypothetical protein
VPCRDDPLPLVTLDALSLGKALVCSNTTGTSAYLQQGISGLILRENTPAEIAETLARLIGKPRLWKKLGIGARQVYEQHFTPPAFTAKLFSALDIEELSGCGSADQSLLINEGVGLRSDHASNNVAWDRRQPRLNPYV